MDTVIFRAASRPLRLVLVGATLAVAWSAVCVIVGAAAPCEAEADSDGLAPLSSLSSVADPIAPIVAPVADLAAPVTAPVAPIVAPVAQALDPVVAPVAAAAAPIAAPVLAPVVASAAAIAAPVVAPVTAVVAPVTAVIAPVVAAVATPVSAVVAPVVTLATDAVAIVPVEATLAPLVDLASAAAPAPTVAPTSDLISSGTSTSAGVASTSFTVPNTSAAEAVLSQAPPAGGPFGAPQRWSAEQAILPTPAGSSSGQTGSAGGLNTASDAPLAAPVPVRLVSSGSSFGTEVLPTAPTFDPGSSPD
ncbi:hypothetical protein [Cryobacterium roopkundense]|uniref:Uncharacterized protein n=1 Tax=Cryobacterium roopkundense TaxID=1001240 RepID=A0A7W9A0A9_9MICO|nr:hypothetical protein [Cryobacterium roopkundense]MBB5643452.1 hypothetical protein [Cryobacterium roopkundense]